MSVLGTTMFQSADQPTAANDTVRNGFTRDQEWRLMFVEATLAAEQYLVPQDQSCVDHQACRRLAFGLWLRVTGRVSEGVEV
jgi:hypothetical protein